MRGQLPDISPSSGAQARHLPPEGKALRYGFPLWGKLSPQVTDEGATAGYFPLIRRAGAPPSPQGEGFFVVRLIFFSLSDCDKIGGAGRVYWGCNQEIRGDKL